MNLLTVENMTKSYTDKILFDNASFSINEGEKIGVIGINGTGKSTLLRIVAGLEHPEKGVVTKGNQVYIRYLPQNPVFTEDSTVLQAVLEDNVTEENQWSIESEAKSILNKLGITDHTALMKHMSGGQKKRIALASTLLATADILILDEPTNHLDNEMSEWLEDYLKRLKGALLMVTHDRYFLDRVSNRIIEIDKGSIYSYVGGYSEFLRLKATREDMENATERKRQSILRNELAWIRRGARARSTKQKARIERYEELVNTDAPKKEENVEISSLSSRLGRKTIEVNNIRKGYDRTLIDDFYYIFLKGDRIGIIGHNGCGKSTLLKIINGVIEPDSGYVEIGTTVKIGYFSQENEYMDENLKVIDYVREGAEYIETVDGKITASQMLERFLFEGSMQWSQIKKLSGGEKRRLYLLRILMEAPNVLILDEPTNDLDIQTMTVLEDYLDTFDGIVITVSHDRYFLDRVVNRIFAFELDGKIRQFEGNYSEYMESYHPEREEEKVEPVVEKVKTEKVKTQKLKFTYQEQRDYETIESDVAKLEEKIEAVEKEMERSATDFPKLNKLMEEKELLEARLEEKMERWMYLMELAEKIETQKA